VVRIEPASQQVLPGEYFTVDVRVENVNNLGAYEFTLQFEPSVISYVTVNNGTFLGSTGRSVFCPAPITDVGTLRFGCVSSDGSTPGPSGSGQLAQVVFQAVAEGTSPLDLVMVALAGPLGEDISAGAIGGSVNVSSGSVLAEPAFHMGVLAAGVGLAGSFGILMRMSGSRADGALRGRRLWLELSIVRRRLLAFLRSLWRGS
jgi:hypothetical protein